jgi:hypothetical protein
LALVANGSGSSIVIWATNAGVTFVGCGWFAFVVRFVCGLVVCTRVTVGLPLRDSPGLDGPLDGSGLMPWFCSWFFAG